MDGDLVTIKVSKGTLALAGITKTGSGLGEQLQNLSLTDDSFNGASVSITAKPHALVAGGPIRGDGSVNVGEISGGGNSLGAVAVAGDLGRITAGGPAGLASLTVGSMGRFGTSTGAANLSSVVGKMGKLTIRTDLDQAAIFAPSGIASIVIGGSLIGGSAADSGSLISSIGSFPSVKIGGSLRGGTGDDTAKISAFISLGSVTIAGSVYGGASSQDIGNGLDGQIHSNVIGSVKIGGSLVGGSAPRSAQIKSFTTIGSVTIGGSLLGGTAFDAGSIIADDVIGTIKIAGDLKGGMGDRAGRIHGNTNITSVTVGGSLIGGTFAETGEIRADFKLGKVTIGQNIVGTDVSGNASLDRAGYVDGDQISSVTIGGSIIAGKNTGTGLLTNSGGIRARHDLGSVIVKGSLIGNATNNVTIAALGQAAPAGSDLAIKSVSVTGSALFAEILAGYDHDNTTSGRGVATDPDAQIGSVAIGGDFTSSSIVAGVTSGTDAFFGDANDAAIAGGNANIFSSIASVVIKGQALGTIAAGDAARFGIVAQSLGGVKIGAAKIPLLAGPGTDTFAAGKAQILGPSLGTFNTDGFDLHAAEV